MMKNGKVDLTGLNEDPAVLKRIAKDINLKHFRNKAFLKADADREF